MKPLATVWHVSREYSGMAEAGGVKDVVRGLAEASVRAGVETTVALPLYGFLSASFSNGAPEAKFTIAVPDYESGNALIEEPVRIFRHNICGVRIFLVECRRFSSKRNVYTYTAEDEAQNHLKKRGTGHWDFHQMNLILQKAVLETAIFIGEAPQVMHCHDGHTAFLPAIMREGERFSRHFARTAVVVTIHNAGVGYHQEVWDQGFTRLLTGLPDRVLEKGKIGSTIDPLLLAGSYAALSTVSEQYGRELLSEQDREIGGGLGKAFRERRISLRGITNGIDPGSWDPRRPLEAGLPYGFDPLIGDLEGRGKCRKALFAALGAEAEGNAHAIPLYGFIGRLTSQKGIDVLFGALRQIMGKASSPLFVVLGQGEKEKEDMMGWLAAQPSAERKLFFVPRYDVRLSKLIFASSDFLLIPSEYEPCGLTDYIAQLSGSIPIVHRVGGLMKVRDGETGFAYDGQSPGALAAAIERTSVLYSENTKLLDRIRRTAFAEIFEKHTWDTVLETGYLPLYAQAAEETRWTER
jgi:starch synthase